MTRLFIALSIALAAALPGCSGMSRSEQVGTVGGAVAGGAVGSAVTGGSTVGTIGGAVVGGAVGHELGREYDQRERRR